MAPGAPDETDRFPDELVAGPPAPGQDGGGDTGALERGRRALERLGLPAEPAAAKPFAATRPPGAGDVVGGVVLQDELGRGGMGVVWRGRDPRLGRDVAVKLLGRAGDDDGLARFRLEAEATARLRHPHVVGVHAAGELRGWPYLVMDLVEGESLARRLDRAPGRRLAPRAAVELARPLAAALAHAHAQGVIHRDVKPGNVLLDASGAGPPRPRLVDFGLARDLRRDGRLTPSGVVVGTPAYMAPEQLLGAPVDGRADVWGLGATLHELLTGKPPFAGHTGAALLGALRRGPASPSDSEPLVDAGLDRLVRTCLEPDPEDRYPTAAALEADLGRWLAGERVRPPSRRGRGGRRPVVAAAALAATVVAGLGLAPALRRGPAPAVGPVHAPAPSTSAAPVPARALTALERLVLEAPRGDPFALLRLRDLAGVDARTPAGEDLEAVQLLGSLLLGGAAPRSRLEARLGDELVAVARDVVAVEERCRSLETWSARGLDADDDVRRLALLVRRLERAPAEGPAGLLLRRRAQRLLGRALVALYLQLGRTAISEPLSPLCQAAEALGPDGAYLLPMRAWLLFMALGSVDAPAQLRRLVAPEGLPPDLPPWQRTLVESMRIVLRRSALTADEAGAVHDEFCELAWRDAAIVVVWLQREVGRLHREEAIRDLLRPGPVGPGIAEVAELDLRLIDAQAWGARACSKDPTGPEGAELAITLLCKDDLPGAQRLIERLEVDPAVQAALGAELDLATGAPRAALARVDERLTAGKTPAATATLRLARAHVRATLGQDYEEDLAAAAALLGDEPPALDVPWLRTVERTRALCQGHAAWPGDLRATPAAAPAGQPAAPPR